jgi:CSLREA domain-containing protein
MLQQTRLKLSHVFSSRLETSRLLSALLTFGVFLFLFLLSSGTASAADYVINNTGDGDDGVCNAANCTLREAIRSANDTPNIADKITFSVEGTITLNNRLPTIAANLEIVGPGSDKLTANSITPILPCRLAG